MRDATDEQLKQWGWRWALRYKGRLMAVTISVFDAERWQQEKIGEVINLEKL